jgi:hypothetical protein
VTERCELHAGCTLRGDIEAPRLVVNENVTFLGSAKVGTGKSLSAWRSPAEPNAVSNAIGYAKDRSRSHHAVIRVYDEAGDLIETHEHAGEFKEFWQIPARKPFARAKINAESFSSATFFHGHSRVLRNFSTCSRPVLPVNGL